MGAQLSELKKVIEAGQSFPVVIGATSRKDPRMVVLFPLPVEYSTTHGGNNPLRVRKVQVTVVSPSALETMTALDSVAEAVQNVRLESSGEYASTVKVSTDDFGAVALEDRLESGRIYSYMTLEWSE